MEERRSGYIPPRTFDFRDKKNGGEIIYPSFVTVLSRSPFGIQDHRRFSRTYDAEEYAFSSRTYEVPTLTQLAF